MKQSLSEVHLQNYLKGNFLGVLYLMNGYVSWSNNALTFDANLSLILPFALSTFNILPLLQPVDTVEGFWVSVQKMTWNITSEVFGGHCHEFLEQAIEFESLLADYMLNTRRNNAVEAAPLSRRAQSIQFDKLQLLVASNCTKTITLLRYLGRIAKCSQDERVYENILKTIMKLASSKNMATNADYIIGTIYFDLKEYSLAVEFLNRSLTSNPGIQQVDAAKTMVLALQRSGQLKLAVDTVKWLVPYLFANGQSNVLDIKATIKHKFDLIRKQLKAPGHTVSLECFLEEIVSLYTEIRHRLTDRYLIIVDLSIAVNNTALCWTMLQSELLLQRTMDIDFASYIPTVEFYIKFCHEPDDSSKDPLSQRIMKSRCLEIAEMDNITRQALVLMQYQLYQTAVRCNYSKAYMKALLNVQHLFTSEDTQETSRVVSHLFNELVDMEHDRKKMHVCRLLGTGSVECQMSRSQVQLLWHLQYELADGLAAFYGNFGMLEKAKEYTEIALEKLPQSSVKRKWKEILNHKLNLAKIELSLGNYWNALYILRNCSLTIDKEMVENSYQDTQQSTTLQSHDLSLPSDSLPSQFAVLANRYGFNTSAVLAAVVSGAARLISHTGAVITASHLLFAAIVVLLWLSMFTVLILIGSAVYCIKLVCSRCSGRHNCVNYIRLLFSDLIIVMCLCSHVVVFYAYVLHFHASTLLYYLNFI